MLVSAIKRRTTQKSLSKHKRLFAAKATSPIGIKKVKGLLSNQKNQKQLSQNGKDTLLTEKRQEFINKQKNNFFVNYWYIRLGPLLKIRRKVKRDFVSDLKEFARRFRNCHLLSKQRRSCIKPKNVRLLSTNCSSKEGKTMPSSKTRTTLEEKKRNLWRNYKRKTISILSGMKEGVEMTPLQEEPFKTSAIKSDLYGAFKAKKIKILRNKSFVLRKLSKEKRHSLYDFNQLARKIALGDLKTRRGG